MFLSVDTLRPLAASGRVSEIAEAIENVGTVDRALARRLVDRLPALLINNDARFERAIRLKHFVSWTRENPNWAEAVRHAVRRPRYFAAFVENWLVELELRQAAFD